MTSTRYLFQNDQNMPINEGSFRTSASAAIRAYRNGSPVKVKLVSGTMVGETNYDQVYNDIEHVNRIPETNLTEDLLPSASNLVGVARKVASCGGPKLDEKQYIAYEDICCSFLLVLVNDGLDMNPSLLDGLGNSFSDYKNGDKVNRIIEELQVQGGREQIIMFLSGPAGAGKGSAVKVARRFCFEFCRVASM